MTAPRTTEQGRRAAAPWQNPEFAGAWAAGDPLGDLLALPRRLAAALVALDRPRSRLIVDIGSGPGAFLAVFLEEFAEARGVWSDASEAMLSRARESLAPYGDRVDYRIVDMTDLSGGAIPENADVIVTSRAAHHLDRAGLAAFYTEAAGHLAPGGWLVDLDHTGPSDVWDQRFRTVRKRFTRPRRKGAEHRHDHPLTSVQDHLDGFAAAGITDVEIAWKAFFTCLFIGRKDG
ncbi:class I SAM-dependent methyltransferase [Actinoallomurus acaciae]|uniref:Class I SAM-dependent methyltransferase n=1 Tax=Actinoallomurus acaciae TaxID=502577 RepID=A0ABV5YC61_9ACTN